MIAYTFSPDEVRAALQSACMAVGGADEWGEMHGWSGRHVRGVLSGQRLIPAGFYPALGFERVTVTVKARAG